MDSNEFDFYSRPKYISLPVPTSFNALPDLPKIYWKQLERAGHVEAELIKKTGISPGTYSSFDDVKVLVGVHDKLWNILEEELSRYDALDVCSRLYYRLETILGHMGKENYDNAAEQQLTGNTEGAEGRFDEWKKITPITEAIKFLIEMAVKCCATNGRICGKPQFDYLIGLSNRVVTLDVFLENLYSQILPYQIYISPKFAVEERLTGSIPAIENLKKSEQPHDIQANNDFIDTLSHIFDRDVTEEDFLTLPGFSTLDKAMTEELGYGIADYLKYIRGVMDLFGEKDFLKQVGISHPKKRLKEMSLTEDKFEFILRDHSLSESIVENLTHKQLMPAERYKRDSRLLRRPVVEIRKENSRILLIGLETFGVGIQVFADSIQFGTLRLPNLNPNGPVKSAIGFLQSQIGAPFRDEIAKKCHDLGFRVEKEWPIPNIDKSGKKYGPIDILVVDQFNKRFILVEAKNLQNQGLNPVDMRNQRERFVGTCDSEGYLSVLSEKEKMFSANKNWHVHKLQIDDTSDYAVEGVIVIPEPILWPLFAAHPLPILDDLEFIRLVHAGQHFLTAPVAIKPKT